MDVTNETDGMNERIKKNEKKSAVEHRRRKGGNFHNTVQGAKVTSLL